MAIDVVAFRCQEKCGITRSDNEAACDFITALLYHDNLMIVANALNALFDVYSEEGFDDVFRAKDLLSLCEQGYPVFKLKIQTAAKSKALKGQNLSFVKSTLLNLRNFIVYKKEHL